MMIGTKLCLEDKYGDQHLFTVKDISYDNMEWNKFIKTTISDATSQWQVSPGDFILTFKIDKVPYGWPVWFTNLRL